MGSVYEIICWTTGLRYIGATKQSLNRRLTCHKSICKNDYGKKCTSRFVLEHGNYEIYELERVESKELLKERELYYIKHTECVNYLGSVGRQESRWKYNRKYFKTERAKMLRRESQKKYDQSEKGKLRMKRYREKRKLIINDNV